MEEREPASGYDYTWAFAKAERALLSWLANGFPPERIPERLAELASLSEGEQLRRVSGGGRFADPELIHCFIERSHSARYRSPSKTLHLARLAMLAAEACTSEVTEGEAALSDLRARAWGQYGTALRISGRLREAEKALATAQRYCKAGTGALELRAWLLQRITALATVRNRFSDAIVWSAEAGAIYEELGERHLLASTLVQRATATLYSGEAERATEILARALPLIDSQEDAYLLLVARHNLARCYIDLNCPEEALAVLCEARTLYQEYQDDLILLRATWQEGMLLREVGHLHNAEAALLRARKGFTEQGLAYEAAMVSLDLAAVYLKLGRSEAVRQVIDEATPIFEAMGFGLEVLTAQVLRHHAETLEVERGQNLGLEAPELDLISHLSVPLFQGKHT